MSSEIQPLGILGADVTFSNRVYFPSQHVLKHPTTWGKYLRAFGALRFLDRLPPFLKYLGERLEQSATRLSFFSPNLVPHVDGGSILLYRPHDGIECENLPLTGVMRRVDALTVIPDTLDELTGRIADKELECEPQVEKVVNHYRRAFTTSGDPFYPTTQEHSYISDMSPQTVGAIQAAYWQILSRKARPYAFYQDWLRQGESLLVDGDHVHWRQSLDNVSVGKVKLVKHLIPGL